MATPAVTVEALPAGYGDCLLVSCSGRRGLWRMLIDTGPDECWPALKARLALLPVERNGRRRIDLLVISHIDHDHIGGVAALLADRDLALHFGDVWFNAPAMPAARGVAEGQGLAELLGAPATALPWNTAWGGRHAVVAAEAPFVSLAQKPGAPKLTLLSPTAASLAALLKVWNTTLGRLREAPRPSAPPPGLRSGGVMDLQALAAKPTAEDRASANGSSIVLLLEHRGVSVLLGADAHPRVLVPALKALAEHRGMALPMPVDVFKLSHHGSRANVTNALLAVVRARHYVISTNGAIFGHPDDEAVARVIVHGGANAHVWFNYRSGKSAKWGEVGLQQAHHYEAHLPALNTAGATVALAAR